MAIAGKDFSLLLLGTCTMTKRHALITGIATALLAFTSYIAPSVWAETPATMVTATASNSAMETITKITRLELKRLMADEGYSATYTSDGHLMWKIDGMRTVMLLKDDGRTLQFFAGIRGASTSMQKVNEWNRTKRFSRSYIDRDGDPILELDLDLEGGVTTERVAGFIRTCRLSFTVWLVLCHNLILGSVWQRGQASIAGAALRVLRSIESPLYDTPKFGCDIALVLCHNLILGSVWQRGQASIAGTALRVLRSIESYPFTTRQGLAATKH
jgi:hypothetical protein